MKVTDLIFFVFSKRYSDEKGSIFNAVAFGFSIPVIFATYLATHFVCGILNTEEKNVPFILELELFISVLILALIFFYYKRGGKGTRIIDHYEKTKYNNWYSVHHSHGTHIVIRSPFSIYRPIGRQVSLQLFNVMKEVVSIS